MNLGHNDSLIGALICLGIGVGWTFVPMSDFPKIVGLLIALAFAVFLCFAWYKRRQSEDVRAEMYANPNAPANVLREYRNLGPDAQQSLMASRPVIRSIPNFNGPIHQWQFPADPLRGWHDDLVVRKVWAAASEEAGMPPIRDYGEGTHERACVIALTGYFISCMWCKPATSNKPAQFLTDGWTEASRSLWGGE